MDQSLFGIVLICIVSLFSIILHEVAHGYVAYIFKDDTAKRAGRLTLNPLPHIDIFGSVIVPLVSFLAFKSLFGWARPVPVSMNKLVGRWAGFWVSAAGVLTNFTLAVMGALLLKWFSAAGMLTSASEQVLAAVVVVNLSLFLFNLIPVPPFDGMAILENLFPRLRIKTAFIYNPMYMIIAIVVASQIFSFIQPYLFTVFLGAFSL